MGTIQVRRTRHAGHCWRSKDELISDILQWNPAYGQAKAERPARTYIQQLFEDTGCIPEDLPEGMNDREKWRERVRNINAGGTTWWWWWWWVLTPFYICVWNQMPSRNLRLSVSLWGFCADSFYDSIDCRNLLCCGSLSLKTILLF